MHKNQNCLHVVLSKLPNGVFSESAGGAPGDEMDRGGKGAGKGKKKGTSQLVTQEALDSITTKNNMMESKSCLEMQATLSRSRRDEKNQRRRLFSELTNHCGNRKDAKKRIKNFQTHLEKDGGGDGEDEFFESQESLIEEILDCDHDITKYEKQLAAVAKNVDTYMN